MSETNLIIGVRGLRPNLVGTRSAHHMLGCTLVYVVKHLSMFSEYFVKIYFYWQNIIISSYDVNLASYKIEENIPTSQP